MFKKCFLKNDSKIWVKNMSEYSNLNREEKDNSSFTYKCDSKLADKNDSRLDNRHNLRLANKNDSSLKNRHDSSLNNRHDSSLNNRHDSSLDNKYKSNKKNSIGKFYRRAMAIGVTIMLTANGCGLQNGDISSNGEDISDVAISEISEGLNGNTYYENKDGVSVMLTTDKLSYEAGEEIHYTLIVSNDTDDFTISAKKFQYTNSANLVAATSDSMPDDLPMLRSGESCTIEGILVGGDGESSTPMLASSSTDVSIRPYVNVSYGGEDATVRCVLNLKLTEVVRQFDSEDKKSAKTVSVHDPSIFKDTDGKYYLVGTHITSASSDDLFDWEDRTSDFRASLSEETIAQIREWNDDDISDWFGYLWAPDIIYNETMGKYCIYLSANGDNWKSNIVLLTGDSIYGPYEYAGSVVYGGFNADTYSQTDADTVLGSDTIPERYITYGVDNKKWGDMYPNCIDPCVFYDEDGNLWMSYGSWSGGIFLLELDEETGLRDYDVTYETGTHSDAYFGKLIAGGSYVSGEGSYIQHIGDYYYLFISYGNLEANGGYNIRVFRSDRPDGGYVDEKGNTPYYDTYSFNYNTGIGVRLFGAYKWKTMSVGQVAQGHNSAFVDDDGKAYIVFHTRTTNGTEGHYVKIHQLFVNKEGWLVAAPYATDSESLNYNGYDISEVAGQYEVIIHNLDVDYKNLGYNSPKKITLSEDGTISGAYEGTWSLEDGTPYIQLEFNGDTYSGVTLIMPIEGSSIETMTFTALGQESQITIWGSKVVE